MKNNKQIIIVLGVYRSGTSALTKGLEVMGVELPDPAKVSFNTFNEKGYWEDQDFFFFNLELIQALGALENRRRNILPLTAKEVDFLCEQGFLEKASQLLREKVPASAPLGIKTSSFSFLLPFWKKVFQECGVQASFVIALRSPLSVVASIEAAQEIIGKQDQEKSFWVWISYMLSCLEHTEGERRVLVDYDELLQAPAREIEKIANALELKINPERLQAYCQDFIDSSLCHFSKNQTRFFQDQFCCTFAIQIYEWLFRVAKDEIGFEDLKKSHKIWKEQFFLTESLLVLVEKMAYEVRIFKATLQGREQIIANLHKTVTKHMHSLAECYKTIHGQTLQIASLVFKNQK